MPCVNEKLIEGLQESLYDITQKYIDRGAELADARATLTLTERANANAMGAVLEAITVLKAVQINGGSGQNVALHMLLLNATLRRAEAVLSPTGLLDDVGQDLGTHEFDSEPVTTPYAQGV